MNKCQCTIGLTKIDCINCSRCKKGPQKLCKNIEGKHLPCEAAKRTHREWHCSVHVSSWKTSIYVKWFAMTSTWFTAVSSFTGDFPSNMNSHGNTQSKTQVDADILSKSSLTCHNLGHRSQTKRLEKQKRGYQKEANYGRLPGIPIYENMSIKWVFCYKLFNNMFCKWQCKKVK